MNNILIKFSVESNYVSELNIECKENYLPARWLDVTRHKFYSHRKVYEKSGLTINGLDINEIMAYVYLRRNNKRDAHKNSHTASPKCIHCSHAYCVHTQNKIDYDGLRMKNANK